MHFTGKRSYFIVALTFHIFFTFIVNAQEIPVYQRLIINQYSADVVFRDEPDSVRDLPSRTFGFLAQSIEMADLSTHNTFDSLLHQSMTFRDKVLNDSVFIIIQTKSFYPMMHNIDYSNFRIDGKEVYGHDGFDSLHIGVGKSHMTYHLASVTIIVNEDTIVYIPQVLPLLFIFYQPRVYKLLNSDMFYMSFSGGDGAGYYFGFFIFDTKGRHSCYVSNEMAFDNVRPADFDILSEGKPGYQYAIREPGGASHTSNAKNYIDYCFQSNKTNDVRGVHWNQYWKEKKTEMLAAYTKMDLSPFIISDSLYGEYGFFEQKNFLLYIHEATKSPTNPLVYHIKGVDKLGNTICRFEGLLTIGYAYSFNNAGKRLGFCLSGNVEINEDRNQKNSGSFAGAWHLYVEDPHSTTPYGKRVTKLFSTSFKLHGSPIIKLCYWLSSSEGAINYEAEFAVKHAGWWKQTGNSKQ